MERNEFIKSTSNLFTDRSCFLDFERDSVHVHCPCQECRGKPVNYKTQERHLSALRLLQQENSKFILLLNV